MRISCEFLVKNKKELEQMSSHEVIAYLKYLQVYKDMILRNVRLWRQVRANTREELEFKIAELEIELHKAERDRQTCDHWEYEHLTRIQ